MFKAYDSLFFRKDIPELEIKIGYTASISEIIKGDIEKYTLEIFNESMLCSDIITIDAEILHRNKNAIIKV